MQTMQTMSKKRPIIRPGQQKPYVKATRREVEQRIKAADVLEDWGIDKSFILDFFREVFGVESRQTERFIARAREAQEPNPD